MTAKADNIILSARGIVNRFGKQTVHDGIDIDVMRGEVLGIAGGSGSGMHSTMRFRVVRACAAHRAAQRPSGVLRPCPAGIA